MTKHEEITILQDAADKLGKDSYCGPWLARQIPLIQQDIQSDFFPSTTWKDTKRDLEIARKEIEEAKKEKGSILASATEEARLIRFDALAYDERVRNEVLAMVRKIEREANR